MENNNEIDVGEKRIYAPNFFYVENGVLMRETELIRCKDCKFYARNKNIFHRGSDCLKRIIDTIVPDRDFCSRAERKKE